MKKQNEIIEKINRLLSENQDIESVIELLRTNNYSKLESIETLRKTLNISYDSSHSIVHNSRTWSDVKEFDNRLTNDFFDVLESLDDLMS